MHVNELATESCGGNYAWDPRLLAYQVRSTCPKGSVRRPTVLCSCYLPKLTSYIHVSCWGSVAHHILQRLLTGAAFQTSACFLTMRGRGAVPSLREEVQQQHRHRGRGDGCAAQLRGAGAHFAAMPVCDGGLTAEQCFPQLKCVRSGCTSAAQATSR